MIWSLKMHSSHSMRSLWRLFYMIKEGLNFLCSVSIAHNVSPGLILFLLQSRSYNENTVSFIWPQTLWRIVGIVWKLLVCVFPCAFDLEATICAVNGETIVISDVRLFASVYRLQVIITESVSIQNSNHNQIRWTTLVGLYRAIGEAR